MVNPIFINIICLRKFSIHRIRIRVSFILKTFSRLSYISGMALFEPRHEKTCLCMYAKTKAQIS